MRYFCSTLVLAVVLSSSTGCAMLASANAHHGGGTGCVEAPEPGMIDLFIGGIGAVALAASGKGDESMGYYVVPGAFVASGVIGSAYAYSCRNDRETNGGNNIPADYYYRAPNSVGYETNSEVDPEARDATPEEMGIGQSLPRR